MVICDYCGKSGHGWQTHHEAHEDVRRWEGERSAMEFAFGDHRPQ